MTVNQLDVKLSELLSQFSSEVKLTLDDEYSKSPAIEGDVLEIAKQTFYLMSAFKDEIINYLKSN